MASHFAEQDKKELARLLRLLKKDGGFWPDETTMRLGHGVVSYWAPELVIRRRRKGKKQVLLAVYEGGIKEFRGKWHFPGGYNLWPERDIQATCSRIGKREIGTRVVLLNTRPLDTHKWRDSEHRYGHPLSLYMPCRLGGKIVETDKLRFFDVDKLPKNIVVPHRRFIKKRLAK